LQLVPLEDFHYDAPGETTAPHLTADEADEQQYRADVLRRCIQELPDGYRVVLSLYLLEGYDHLEIASILGITESTSKSQYSRARTRLRELASQRGLS
jgi:RNA polymerase sigma factor (sigma-70 family)